MKQIRINKNINEISSVFNFYLHYPPNNTFNSPILLSMGRFNHNYKIKLLNKKLLSIKWIIPHNRKISILFKIPGEINMKQIKLHKNQYKDIKYNYLNTLNNLPKNRKITHTEKY